MRCGGLKKSFSEQRIEALMQEPLFPLLAADVAKGEVLPAVRDEEMHFYYRGARMLTYRSAFKTHSRYQCRPTPPKETPARYEPLRMRGSLAETYSELKMECGGYRPKGELMTVAQVYRSLSHARRGRPADAPSLLDVEIRFPGPAAAAPRTAKKKGASDMVDMLFVLPGGRLCLVEAKRTEDTRARSQTEPEVANQIRDYESQAKAVDDIVMTYNQVQDVFAKLFGCSATPLTGVFHKVPLLILGKWSPSPLERWQAHWLEKSSRWTVEDEFILIDGADDPARALQRFLTELDHRLA